MKIKKVTPTLNHVLTTAVRYKENQMVDGLVESGKTLGEMKEYQRIVAIGPNSHANLKVGDLVVINPKNYAHPVHKDDPNSITHKDNVEIVIEWPMLDIGDNSYLYIYDTDIELIIDDWEDEEGNDGLVE